MRRRWRTENPHQPACRRRADHGAPPGARSARPRLDRGAAGLGHRSRDVAKRLLAAPAGRGIVVGKTGTFGSEGASALAGALRTKQFGIVTFAVLNHGVAVPEARRRWDAFVGKLAAALGAEPWRIRPPPPRVRPGLVE